MKLTYRELTELRSLAVDRFVSLPEGTVLAGSPHPTLNADDRRVLALFEAAMYILGRKGLLNSEANGALTHEIREASVFEQEG